MLPAQRRGRIIEILRANHAVSLRDLADSLDTSVSTVRRDVEYLDENGYLKRTHGGAVLEQDSRTTFEPTAEIAAALAPDAKRAIGVQAAALIRPGQTVIFDSGTTALAAAKAAKQAGTRFTAITNDLTIAALLSADNSVEVIVPGGTVRPGSPTLIGTVTQQFISNLNADMAFIGTHAITDDHLSDTSIELAEVKRAMIASARHVVLLADSTKIGRRAFARFARFADLDRFVSDTDLPHGLVSTLDAMGLDYQLVDPAKPGPGNQPGNQSGNQSDNQSG